MNLENTVLNEMSQSHIRKYGMIPLTSIYEVSKILKFIESKNKMVVTKGWGERVMGSY